jgi:hypothetical protein
MLWIDLYDSVFQFPPIFINFAQPLKRSGTTFHRPQSTAWSALCEGDVLHEANGGHTRYGLVFRFTPLLCLKVSVANRFIYVFPVM